MMVMMHQSQVLYHHQNMKMITCGSLRMRDLLLLRHSLITVWHLRHLPLHEHPLPARRHPNQARESPSSGNCYVRHPPRWKKYVRILRMIGTRMDSIRCSSIEWSKHRRRSKENEDEETPPKSNDYTIGFNSCYIPSNDGLFPNRRNSTFPFRNKWPQKFAMAGFISTLIA